MNRLAELVQGVVHLDLRLLHRFLGGIDRVREQVATLLDAGGVAAFVQGNPLRLEKVAEVAEQFVLLDGFHSSFVTLPRE